MHHKSRYVGLQNLKGTVQSFAHRAHWRAIGAWKDCLNDCTGNYSPVGDVYVANNIR